MLIDFGVGALARKWCLRTRSKYHTPACRICVAITGAIREALEEAETVAEAEEGATWDVGSTGVEWCGCPKRIAAAIAALRKETK